MDLNDVFNRDIFEESRKYFGPIFLLSGLINENPLRIFTTETITMEGNRGKILKMRFKDNARINNEISAKNFFKNYYIEIPVEDIFVSARLLKNKYNDYKRNNKEENLKVWKAAKQPTTRNSKSDKSVEKRMREKMYLPIDKNNAPSIWENVSKAVSKVEKISKYPGDTLISLSVLLFSSGTKMDLARVFEYVEITDLIIFNEFHPNQRGYDMNMIPERIDSWLNVTHSCSYYPRKIPHLISTVMRLNEGLKSLNNDRLVLSYHDKWTFYDILPPKLSNPIQPSHLTLGASLLLNGKLTTTYNLDYFICGHPKLISRATIQDKNLCFFHIPRNISFNILFTFTINNNNPSSIPISPSKLFFIDKVFQSDQSNPSFAVPNLSLNQNTCLMIRFLIYDSYFLDLPCFFHV